MVDTKPKSKRADGDPNERVAGPPLDFSWWDIKDIQALITEEPRAGKRKPICKQEDGEGADQNEAGGGGPNMSKEDEQSKKRREESWKPPQAAGIQNLYNVHSIALTTNKNVGGRKFEEVKEQTVKKRKVLLKTSSLILSHNEIRSLQGICSVLSQVMYDHMNLEWIDLSHNYLVDIHSDLLEHEQLKTLYLHSNYISSMKDVKKLSKLTYLRHVTLYANPIAKSQYIIPEQIGSKFGNQLETPCYRPCVMGLLPQLVRLDSVMITRKEKENARVWKRGHAKVLGQIGPPPDMIGHPPDSTDKNPNLDEKK